mmetsp:Transcript_7336/g.13898  ORF Transcript_7336/g.13898 Transcript_7336/m.13898 type:complete len:235 (-) Transcript_7336:120-824(-)
MNMRTVCILKPSVYSKTNAPSLVAGERMALRRSICKGGLHKSTMGKPGREHDLRFRNGSRSASVCLCDMSDNQQKTRREDLAKPFIPLTAKVIPNVPFVKVDVVKQNDKAGPMQVVGTLDIGNYDEEEVYQLLTDHINSHRIFRTILDVQQTQNADGSISLVQNCQWKFTIFSGSFPVALRVVEDPANHTFSFEDTSKGGFMKEMYGSWQVRPSSLVPGIPKVQSLFTFNYFLF